MVKGWLAGEIAAKKRLKGENGCLHAGPFFQDIINTLTGVEVAGDSHGFWRLATSLNARCDASLFSTSTSDLLASAAARTVLWQ